MAILEYGIGGNEVKVDTSEAIANIPENRSLIVEQLTADEPVTPGSGQRLKHYRRGVCALLAQH